MSYSLFILRRAQRELSDLPKGTFERVCEAIQSLAQEPRPTGCLKLTGRPAWRIRVSDYRVIYEIDDTTKAILILHIGHRRDVYR
jgi:mRNA interferase RelE/StbE